MWSLIDFYVHFGMMSGTTKRSDDLHRLVRSPVEKVSYADLLMNGQYKIDKIIERYFSTLIILSKNDLKLCAINTF